ncbi:MAG: DUF1684 domain-containing protein [Bacteroidota bacterium]
MKSSHILVLTFVIAIIGFVMYSLRGGQSDEGYTEAILKEREEKNAFMKSEESPFTDTTKIFDGLKYFPPDVKYRVTANLEVTENKKVVMLLTSDGKEQRYLEYAYATFGIDGVENKLLILEIMDIGPQRGKLFLAFADATSALETYGAGRYLDVKKVPGATSITLDFNQAYNPYCAYSDAFSCPFPPRENILTTAIRAGEKSYHE